uniref:Transposase Helix-turn-helix domain-containing protein n=1 Tax=Knipowitschia caucasica TaxID=637954 RepID=A0AAV2K4P9_KNICA
MSVSNSHKEWKQGKRGFVRISYQDSNYRRSIPAEERLSICLRFLATGDSYRTIAGSFRAGISTVSMLIPDVVAAIWDCLVEEFMAVPGAEEWRVTVHFKNSAEIGSGMRLRQPSLQQQRLRAPFE